MCFIIGLSLISYYWTVAWNVCAKTEESHRKWGSKIRGSFVRPSTWLAISHDAFWLWGPVKYRGPDKFLVRVLVCVCLFHFWPFSSASRKAPSSKLRMVRLFCIDEAWLAAPQSCKHILICKQMLSTCLLLRSSSFDFARDSGSGSALKSELLSPSLIH